MLNKSKKSVLVFFRGAGVSDKVLGDLWDKVNYDRASINKYEIARSVLMRINEKGESSLRERREIVKRVVEFESFTNCWPDDQYKAKGLVAEIKEIVNRKDAFTRMADEREKERKKHRKEYLERVEKEKKKKERISNLKSKLFSLFKEKNPQRRGKNLEGILNEVFKEYGISIREAFSLSSEDTGGIYEQIDGVISLDSDLYLVEMKWKKIPVDKNDVNHHLVRVYHRGFARGIFISASGYTEPAIFAAKESLQRTVFVLSELSEFVKILEDGEDLKIVLRNKIEFAILDKNPYKLSV